MRRPVVGITVDRKVAGDAPGRYEVGVAYSAAVSAAGGLPVLLPHVADRAAEYVALCDAIVFTGGLDPRTEAFGEPTHPKARPMDADRQAFELAMLDALDLSPDKPVLGVCLGMQLMALHAGGSLDQYLPDTLGEEAARAHQDNRIHPVVFQARGLQPPAFSAEVTSSHRQAVRHAGSLRVLATAPDGVIEAIDAPGRCFYVGVQWHPERGDDGPINAGLFAVLLAACRCAT